MSGNKVYTPLLHATSEERPEPLGSTGKGEAGGFVEGEKKEKNLEDFFRLMDPEGFSSGDKK